MNITELPYPLRSCVELINFALLSCPKTQDKRMSEIKEVVCQFFEKEMVDEAVDILCGRNQKTSYYNQKEIYELTINTTQSSNDRILQLEALLSQVWRCMNLNQGILFPMREIEAALPNLAQEVQKEIEDYDNR